MSDSTTHTPALARVALVSLGCPKNLVDAEVMLGILAAAGHPIVEDVDEAEVVIVNTCAFIEPAQEEAIDALVDLADRKKAGLLRGLICSGCLTERHGATLIDELPEVDVFINPGAVERIAEAVADAVAGRRRLITEPLTYIYCADTPRWRSGSEWLAYLKIADGCDNRCSYCTVPDLRGSYRSRRPDDIRKEFDHLTADGVREVCLVAQDTTSYGHDLQDGTDLSGLLRLLDASGFGGWVRLLYMHPAHLSDELIETVAASRCVVPYFDIPLQHAARPVLQRMGRPGDAGQYLRMVERIRGAIPHAALRTTFIVGFPGETSDDVDTLVSFVEQARFDRLSVFRYWPEEGTPAALLPDQVPMEIGDERLDTIMQTQEQVSRQIGEGLVERTMRVLIERHEPQWQMSVGRSYRDAPEVDAEVKVNGIHPVGQFIEARITGAEIHDLRADVTSAK